ncbi:MAG TPA: hypothetical protein VLE96_03710 [Chlamydiales bacterium]|nr:hypothetical protein [Chlamydiales bacterium]
MSGIVSACNKCLSNDTTYNAVLAAGFSALSSTLKQNSLEEIVKDAAIGAGVSVVNSLVFTPIANAAFPNNQTLQTATRIGSCALLGLGVSYFTKTD